MQMHARVVLLAAYLFADFVYPGDPVSGGARPPRWSASLKYALAHYFTAAFLAGLLEFRGLISWRFQAAALVLTAMHSLLHQLEHFLAARESIKSLLLDQLAHAAMLGV